MLGSSISFTAGSLSTSLVYSHCSHIDHMSDSLQIPQARALQEAMNSACSLIECELINGLVTLGSVVCRTRYVYKCVDSLCSANKSVKVGNLLSVLRCNIAVLYSNVVVLKSRSSICYSAGFAQTTQR